VSNALSREPREPALPLRAPSLEVLDPNECLRLLRSAHVGRLAIVRNGRPLIFPVNFALDGNRVVMRTAEGTKHSAADGGPAAFEVDQISIGSRVGWSVVLEGHLHLVTQDHGPTFTRVDHLPLAPWAGHDAPHLLRLVPDKISGRRIAR